MNRHDPYPPGYPKAVGYYSEQVWFDMQTEARLKALWEDKSRMVKQGRSWSLRHHVPLAGVPVPLSAHRPRRREP